MARVYSPETRVFAQSICTSVVRSPSRPLSVSGAPRMPRMMSLSLLQLVQVSCATEIALAAIPRASAILFWDPGGDKRRRNQIHRASPFSCLQRLCRTAPGGLYWRSTCEGMQEERPSMVGRMDLLGCACIALDQSHVSLFKQVAVLTARRRLPERNSFSTPSVHSPRSDSLHHMLLLLLPSLFHRSRPWKYIQGHSLLIFLVTIIYR